MSNFINRKTYIKETVCLGLFLVCLCSLYTRGYAGADINRENWVASDLYSKAYRHSISNPKKALYYYKLVIKNTEPDSRLYRLSEMGIASSYAKIGNFEESIDMIRQSLKGSKIDLESISEFKGNIAKLQAKYGNADKAIEAYKQVLKKYPNQENECYLALEKSMVLYSNYNNMRNRNILERQDLYKIRDIYSSRKDKINWSAAKSDIEANLPIALDIYEMDNGTYPTTQQGLEALKDKPLSKLVPAEWKGPYIKRKDFKDPWGNEYVYICPGTHNKAEFDLYSKGKNGIGDGTDIDDINNWRL